MLTDNGGQFVTPLSLQALSESKVYTDLFSLTDESEMGHIQLSRSADLLVVAPATANILAKMAAGLADDLASTRAAGDRQAGAGGAGDERAHVAAPGDAGQHGDAAPSAACRSCGPNEGAMACNEFGPGRLAEPPEILAAIERILLRCAGPLAGRHALVTSGPTHEPIDPVRYIANRSSGRQGHAIAAALAALGARVTLVSGPVVDPRSARRDGAPCRDRGGRCWTPARSALPADVAVFAAAVADWRVANSASTGKIKKQPGAAPPALTLVPNPDILATIAAAGPRAPAPRGRLRGRDRRPDGQRAGQARAQERRLDRRQRRLAGDRHHGRRGKRGAPDHRQRHRDTGRVWPRTTWRGAWRARIAAALA